MPFQEISSPSLRKLFVQQLEGLILSGELRPGDRLPTERELADEMNISKTVVHEGLRELHQLGFLQVESRKGVTVADYAQTGSLETLMAIMDYHGGLPDKKTASSILDLRYYLEAPALRQLAAHHTPGDLAALLTNLQEGDILFIDEIHRLSRQVEEVLYPALEDFALDIMIGKGPSAQSIRINLPRFTLVGATTRAGQLTGPLRDRFGILLKLEPYSPRELGRIILRSAGILGVPITEEGALELARCARGTPRIANRMLKRVRDFATVQGDGTIDEETAIAARKWMDIDELGLDELDRSVLRAIIEMYGGGPVGLETLAAALGEESVTLEDICEPYLMQMGMLTRTPRGRCVTRLAYEHLHMAVPKRFDDEDSGQTSMF